ncbi:hypothetical protein SETIT_5G219800v2 [Setaria italica]|uniref:Uncharacterized protein n=1 Tax=Setaria italica TaxID=4555 RepID=A0A368R968_SETIT|nr:hypothetical protein SETIT_5G219800v2 [Setaria italica]
MLVPCAPHPTSFHPYSSWGWNDPWTHTPYFRPYHVEYAAPREPSCARQPYVENDRFEHKDWSRVQNKKNVVKQVYQVKRDGRKDKSSDLNSIRKKSAIDSPSTKSEQNKLKTPKNKKRVLLSKTEGKPSHPLGLLNRQKKKPQKLSA